MPDLPDVFEKSFDEIELTVDKAVNDQNVPPNPFKFKSIIKKRGRPKLGRDGAPIKNKKPKKKKNLTDFIDNNLTVHKSVSIQKISTKKRGRPPKTNSNTSKNTSVRKYVRGPYKKKLNQNLSTSSILSSLRSSTLGSYNNKTPRLPSTQPQGPMRAPHTIEALRLDYPEGFSSPSTCYTCDFKLDIHTTKAGERVIKCTRCNKCEIHESCYRNCRTCEDLQLI